MNLKEYTIKNNLSLLNEWDYNKNNNSLPENFSTGSGKKVWWKCKHGHSWQTSISHRVRGNSCPYCGNKKALAGFNDLATTQPEIAKEWDYEKNKDLKPTDVIAGSGKKVWWKCKHGHSWQTSISHRTKGTGCPYCSSNKILSGFNDLATTHPEIAKEWDNEKNKDLKPTDVIAGSGKKVWWKCKHEHSWQTSISHRVRGNSCPYCGNKKVLAGFNDLATTHPEIAKEWDNKKNKDLKPTDVIAGSGKKVWWKCKHGHSWQTQVYVRTSGHTCPFCNKGCGTSFNEQVIYYYIQKKYRHAKNRDRIRLGGSELDIYIPEIDVGIEYDDYWTHKNKEKDNKKNRLCSKNKLKLYRIRDVRCPKLEKNNYVKTLSGNLKSNTEFLKQLKILIKELYIKDEINLENDVHKIYSNYIFSQNENSFEKNYPEQAKEWDYEKNGTLKPDMFSMHSGKKVWWKCKHGHSWQASIDNRARGTGCPTCANKRILQGVNDIATTHPKIAKEWDYEKNKDLKPTDVTKSSKKIVWWKCKHGHSWQTSITNRARESGCPYCSGRKVLAGFNDLATTHPEIAKEWDNENKLTPYDVSAGSNKKVTWVCKKGHKWVASIYSRSSGMGCPFCSNKKVLSGFNDLATTHPEIAKEWDYEKNKGNGPSDFTSGSQKKVWWKCKHGHSWLATISHRTHGSGCHYCTNRKVLAGFNDLATTHPEIAKEWDYKKNNNKTPDKFSKGSQKKVWWKCKHGHSWQTSINNRTKGTGCPYCSRHKVFS